MTIVALALIGSAWKSSAVGITQPKEFVIVEVTVGKESYFHKLKVAVASSRRKFMDDQFDGGGFGLTGSCPRDIGCEYSVIAIADAISEDESKVSMGLSFKERKACDFDKEFIVVRGSRLNSRARAGSR